MSGVIMKTICGGHTIMNNVNVDSVAEYSKGVERPEGKIITPKTEVTGMDWLVIFVDVDDNSFAL